ncbi:MAG: site-specific integrase, partial [Candidatus Thermoplasmatota archaeon]|nr:site-specific integrase [Candidatus Thermoplasmatota archaeon]
IYRLHDQDPDAEPPPEWIIYWTTGRVQRLTTLKETMADNMISAISERSGIIFTAHTLRRSYGRSLFEAGVPLVTIARILGHSSVKTTERYLGINDDDIAEGMTQAEQFYENVIDNMEGHKNVEKYA